MSPSQAFETQTLSTTVVRPSNLEQNPELLTKPLSIIDNTVANFSPAGTVLFFSPPSTVERTNHSLLPSELIASLSTCLNGYPWLAGHLHFVDPTDTSFPPYQRRYGRLAITYGSLDHSKTPGVQFATATTTVSLASILQPPERASSGLQVSVLPDASAFFPTTNTHPLAFSNLKPSGVDVPATIIQHTTHPCGSISLAVKIAHPLSDTQALFAFLKAWAATHRSIFSSETEKPHVSSLSAGSFSPSHLDTAASGDLNFSAGPNPDLVSISRSLPLSRFSWWKHSSPGCPWDSAAARVPEELQPYEDDDDDGDPLPWAEWDVGKKTECRAMHFSAEEIDEIFRDATTTEDGDERSSVTTHTALVAYVWRLITSARQVAQDRRSHSRLSSSIQPPAYSAADSAVSDENIPDDNNDIESSQRPPQLQLHHLHLTLGLRSRLYLQPPRSPSNLKFGSPILNGTISAPLSSLLNSSPSSEPNSMSSLSATSSLVQSVLSQFMPTQLGALLHDLAHDPCPWRIWHAFLGERRVLCTSWVKSGVWDVNFSPSYREEGQGGQGQRLIGMLPLMPPCEGLVVIVEHPPGEKDEKTAKKKKKEKEVQRKWWSNGVDVICWLDEGTWREMLGET